MKPGNDAAIGRTRRLLLKLLGLGGLAGAAAAVSATGPAKGSPGGYPFGGAATLLAVLDAGAALRFYEEAFGVSTQLVVTDAEGRVAHAEFLFDSTLLMVSTEIPALGLRAPSSLGGFSACVLLHVADLDAAVQRAVSAGAELTQQPVGVYPFLRRARVDDPFGHRWQLTQRTRVFTHAELFEAAQAQRASGTN